MEKEFFHEKLIKCQNEIGKVTKDKENPFFKSKYVDINSLLDAVREPLYKYSLSLIQSHESNQFGDFVKTVISDGTNSLSSMTKIVVAKANDPQAYGSAITYARRYGLQSLLCIEAEDDDGNLASNRFPQTKKPTNPNSVWDN